MKGRATHWSPFGRRVCGSTLVFGALCLLSTRAHATGAKDMYEVMRVIEVITPDTRLELGDPTALVLSFPAHGLINGSGNHTPRGVWVSMFLEPQVQLRGPEWRGLLGSRVWVPLFDLGDFDLALVVEGAGAMATDGLGATVGAGLSGLETGVFGASVLGVVYRYILTTEGTRHDIGIDLLTIPF